MTKADEKKGVLGADNKPTMSLRILLVFAMKRLMTSGTKVGPELPSSSIDYKHWKYSSTIP